MHLHIIQHVPFEDAAYIADWAAARGDAVAVTHLYRGDALPDPDAADLHVVMGGPMNIYEDDRYPWLRAEKAFLARVAATGCALGICLGAQLLADVLGGPVTRNAVKEIGWLPVTRVADTPLLDGLPATFPAFHWHGDTFALPPGAVHAARSAACAHQAFAVDDRVLGLQFHLESTPASIDRLIAHGGDELVDGPYIQPVAALRAGDTTASNRLMARVLDNFARRIA
jgi:GMP synthase-like glutamine amidotransferase